MIERNLQYVTVRKYGSAFLEAFGMLPLTYFGAVGDNQTDNYANIQVAINESIKRGLNFIFVPNGTYYYQGFLLDVDKITFIGNSKYAKIYDGETEIPIYQIGAQLPYIIGEETVTKEIPEVGETGYVEETSDITIPIKKATEAILVINGNIIYVTEGLVVTNGLKLGKSVTFLTDDYNCWLTGVEFLDNAIRIEYKVADIEEESITIEFNVEWRVR